LRRLRVFVPYASEDKSRVRTLTSRLQDDNIDAWMNEKRLLVGSDWEREIAKAIRQADTMVLCLSRASAPSGDTFKRSFALHTG
jgi:hypothetical protein